MRLAVTPRLHSPLAKQAEQATTHSTALPGGRIGVIRATSACKKLDESSRLSQEWASINQTIGRSFRPPSNPRCLALSARPKSALQGVFQGVRGGTINTLPSAGAAPIPGRECRIHTRRPTITATPQLVNEDSRVSGYTYCDQPCF